MGNITLNCYKKSIELLEKNATKYGILASSYSARAKKRNYLSIFGRDASICAMGMIGSGENNLIKIAQNSLETLGRNQAVNGQIPNFVTPEDEKVDFWRMGTIDSTLWWLIAVDALIKSGENSFVKKFDSNIKKAIAFLQAWEHPTFNLLVQLEASDWADLMPRSGYVLYSNALWCRIKEIYNLSEKEKTKEYFKYLFDAKTKIPKKINQENIRFVNFALKSKRDKNTEALASFVRRYESGNEVDVFGNCLSCIFGAVDKNKSKKILSYLLKNKVNKPFSVKTVLKPITPKSAQWKKYMSDHKQNYPYKYHNGGVWPFISAFWIVALFDFGYKEEAKIELEKLARLNLKSGFNEWFHGKSGRAMGKKGQSWNAGMYIYAYNKINK